MIYVRVTWFPSGHCLYFLWLFNHYVRQELPRTLRCLRNQMTSWPVQTRLAGSVTSPPPTSHKELSQPGTGSAPAGQTGPGVFLSSDSDLGCKAGCLPNYPDNRCQSIHAVFSHECLSLRQVSEKQGNSFSFLRNYSRSAGRLV